MAVQQQQLPQLGQETVPFSLLSKRAAEDAFTGLKELCDAAPEQSDSERKIALLKYLLKTRQRMLRLFVIGKWCRQIPLVERCQQLVGTLSNHDMSFTQAADSLFYLHESLQQSRAPMYDVPSAIDVLLTGGFHRIPKCIEDLDCQPVLDGEKRRSVLQKLDTILRSKLLDIHIPREFSSVTVRDGRITLRVDGEFGVELTLGYRGNASLWRVLHLELLVGEPSGPAKFSEIHRLGLGDDLERRMAALENPFGIIYTVLHEFCSALVMDTLCRQVHGLRLGRWRDAIRLDLSSDSNPGQQQQQQQTTQADAADADGLKSRVLKITYWLELPKSAGADAGLPNLRIEPGSDHQITCQHHPPVTDPKTDNEAEFVLDQSCVDVEKLILRAINCNIHSRLVQIQRSLKNHPNICRIESDVVLRSSWSYDAQDTLDQLGENSLHVRAYADRFICIGINIRNGRFILRAPGLLPASVLQEMEDALNQGTMSSVDVFSSLRVKAIIHHFASLGASIGLKVYEPGSKLGPSVLVLGFPNTGDVYFLTVQIDQNFMPLFVLLEAEKQASSNRPSSRQILARRRMTIDIEKFFLTGDDANLSLLSGKPKASRDVMPKVNELKPGIATGPRIAKLEHTGFPTGQQWQRSPAAVQFSPSASSLSSPPPSRTGFGNQSSVYHSRKSSSANNLLSLVPQSAASPARNSINRMSPSSKLSDIDYVRSKSPLHAAASPDLDDDLSKLIESISTGGDNLISTGSTRQGPPPARMIRSGSKSSLVVNQKSSASHHRMVLSESKEDALVRSPHHLASPARQRTGKRRHDSEILSLLPKASYGRKKLKTESEQGGPDSFPLESFVGQSYSAIAAAVGQGKAPLVSHMAVLLHVVKRCWLAIKHARLTNQMDALGMTYIEEGGSSSSSSLIFRLGSSELRGDMGNFCSGWQHMHLNLGKRGSDGWEVKLRDPHYRTLWKLQKQATEWGSGVQFAASSEADAHIKCNQEGLFLSYSMVEDDSVKKLMTDLERLRSARAFALCMKNLLEARTDGEAQGPQRGEAMNRQFKIEAVGLTSLWFSYTGRMPGVLARFVVEWGAGLQGCTVHVSPEQLWPHTKCLEDFINGGDVQLLLDAIRITSGPLHALAGAIRPARMTTPVPNTTAAAMVVAAAVPPGKSLPPAQASSSPSVSVAAAQQSRAAGTPPPSQSSIASVSTVTSSGHGRGPVTGIVPSSLLPTDISVLMRSPYWIRIVYRKQFSVDMRCFEGDQVWLQPAPPPQGAGPEAGGSLPCPQFRPFVMENVALGLNNPEASGNGTAGTFSQASAGTGSRPTSVARPTNSPSGGSTAAAAAASSQTLPGNLSIVPGRSLVIGGGPGVYPGYRGELNSAFCGMSDDGGYGGAWVPLAALKKVLRSTLKYLGVLWLFAQFPNIIKEVLGAIMNGRDGTLLHLDAEQPALRFNIGNCMFAVNMHRHQLYLQGVNVKKFHQHQAQAQAAGADADLTGAEMTEIADFFARRVASEPYDASRLASFVTILTLPVAVLREFLCLISWKKETQKNLSLEATPRSSLEATPRSRIELCLENRLVISAYVKEEAGGATTTTTTTTAKSSIQHDRERGVVEFALNVFLDHNNSSSRNITPPQVNVNVAGGAGWLPHCVSVRLRYYYSEGGRLVIVNMEGSHAGKACWSRDDEWERVKERTTSAVEAAAGQELSGRLRAVAEAVHLTVQSALQQLRAV